MKTFDWLYHILLRFRYPVTLPEEIAADLGLTLSNFHSFHEFLQQITNASCRPERLKRFMTRDDAEAAFECAQRKEKFGRNSLFSYYFSEGWLEFSLYFDEKSRLRRVYLQHQSVEQEPGIEISLHQVPSPYEYNITASGSNSSMRCLL